MADKTAPPPLAPELAASLATFARSCKAAARAVALYPPEHPAIEAALNRLGIAAGVVTERGPYGVQVSPDDLLVGGRAAARPDPAIGELASLLHSHLVGSLTISKGIDVRSWRAFLTLLTLPVEDVRAKGGIERAWTTGGGHGIELDELDYASILRERTSGDVATWDTIIENALRTDALELDEATLKALADLAADPTRLADFVSRFEDQASAATDVRGRTTALLRIISGVTDFVGRTDPDNLDTVLGNLAYALMRVSADVMLEMLSTGRDSSAGTTQAQLVTEIRSRVTDPMLSRFVARSVTTERGCTARLAEAFRTLAPEVSRQREVAALAREELVNTTFGSGPEFDDMWSRVESFLMSYSDRAYVSATYNAELSAARAQSLEIEHLPDDPPERIAGWLTTVSDVAVRTLDVQLLCDLLVVESEDERWHELLEVVTRYAEDLVLVGDFDAATRLVSSVSAAAAASRAEARGPEAASALEHFARGPMMGHLATHLNTIRDEDFDQAKALCAAIGPSLIPPLAETLAGEERARSRLRLTDLLLEFGEPGRGSIDHLRQSPNASVRRTAVQLLRAFGGESAVADLAEMLEDPDSHVQREAVRALISIATDEAYALLEDTLGTDASGSRRAVMQELSTTRDERATPLFCYMVRHMECRGRLREFYLKAVSRLGVLGGSEAVEALGEVLNRGSLWAPMRAKEWRTEAAAALARIDLPEARQVLEDAVERGSFGVRKIARRALGGMTNTE